MAIILSISSFESRKFIAWNSGKLNKIKLEKYLFS